MRRVFVVGGGEGVTELDDIVLDILPRKYAIGLVAPHVGQLLSLHIFHGEKRILTGHVHKIVNANNIGMAELSTLLHLALHVIKRAFIHSHFRREAL